MASEQASAWLNAVPVPSLGLKLDNGSIRLACGLRLRTKICQPHTCICGSLVDEHGRHGLSCKNAKGTNSRHHHINDLIRRALVSANIPAVCEPPGLHRSDNKRVDGMTIFPWKEGKSLMWHVTPIDPKSALVRLTAGESAVVCLGFAQTEVRGLLPSSLKKIKWRGYDHGRGSW